MQSTRTSRTQYCVHTVSQHAFRRGSHTLSNRRHDAWELTERANPGATQGANTWTVSHRVLLVTARHLEQQTAMGAMRTDEGRSMRLDERFDATTSKADALMARLTAARDPTRAAATTTFALPDPTLRSSLRAPYRPIATRHLPTPSEAPAASAPPSEATAASAPPPPAIQPSAFTARKLPSARAVPTAAATARQRKRLPQPNQDSGGPSVPVRRLAFAAAAAPLSEGQWSSVGV